MMGKIRANSKLRNKIINGNDKNENEKAPKLQDQLHGVV